VSELVSLRARAGQDSAFHPLGVLADGALASILTQAATHIYNASLMLGPDYLDLTVEALVRWEGLGDGLYNQGCSHDGRPVRRGICCVRRGGVCGSFITGDAIRHRGRP
jgi:hypothetical protein